MAKTPTHSGEVLDYLRRLYGEEKRTFACRADSAEGVAEWQRRARPVLRHLIGLDRIAEEAEGHKPTVSLQEPKDCGDYTRRLGTIASEPHISVPFWLLKPKKSRNPLPLGVFPHGHKARGMDEYVGIAHGEKDREHIESEERDVAVQAVRQGFLAIAPTTRGFPPAAVPDLTRRHGGAHCRSQLIHCLLAGRTAMGERVWDMMRLLDWAAKLPEVDGSRVLVMGNSGGGMVTIYAAACDERIQVAVPSCSFAPFIGLGGLAYHCDCNAVPGILRFGQFWDVAGLIAPRHLCIVNGRLDRLFPVAEVERAAEGVRRIYAAAGVPDRFAHRWGEGGHRFYKALMRPFIRAAFGLEG